MIKIKTQNLATEYPDVAADWHPSKNNNLTPYNVSPGSHKIVFWKCSKNPEHEWQQEIRNRTVKCKSGCPYCDGRLASPENNLEVHFPDIAKEWHPTKNGELTPRDVTYGSHRKVWWKCLKNTSHEWQAKICNRTKKLGGTGCNYCASKKASPEWNLEVVYPEIAKQLHPTLNGNINPKELLPNSGKKVWWLCPLNPKHVWKATIDSRTKESARDKGCPFCSGKQVLPEESFGALYPEKAKEWHPTKNGSLTPYDVSAGSHKRVWWKCLICNNEHPSRVKDKVKAAVGCPSCSLTTTTSNIEFRIYTELKTIFDKVEHKNRNYGKEIDIYIPKYKLAIEYDSLYYHKDRIERDIKKHTILNRKGLNLLRIIDDKSFKLYDTDILIKKYRINSPGLIIDILLGIQKVVQLDQKDNREVKDYIAENKLRSNEEFVETLRKWYEGYPIKTLDKEYPEIAKLWDYNKNYPYTPDIIHPGTNERYYFKCKNGHSTLRLPLLLIKGHGCNKCYLQSKGQPANIKESFGYLYPNKASYWDYEKNGKLTPFMVKANSDRQIWLTHPETGESWKTRVRSTTARKKDTLPLPPSCRKPPNRWSKS